MSILTEASTATPSPSERRGTISPAQRKWTFLDKQSGDPLTFTCMPGCIIRHDVVDEGQRKHPSDVHCWAGDNGAASLPIDSAGSPENVAVLSARIVLTPFASSMAARLPQVLLEVIEDQYIEGLDPDSLAVVIDALQERVDALRRTHGDLVRLRGEYLGQPAPAAMPRGTQPPRAAHGDTDPGAVSRAWDAIEDVFKTSGDPRMTRSALREFVDLTADKAEGEKHLAPAAREAS